MVSCRGLLSHRCLVDMSCEQVLCAKRRVCSQDMSTREGGLLLTSLVNTVGLPMADSGSGKHGVIFTGVNAGAG